MWPLGGGKVWLRAGAQLGRREDVLFILSGLAVNAVAAVLALAFSDLWPTVLTGFFFTNAAVAVYSFVPASPDRGGVSDGTYLFLRLGLLPGEYRRAVDEQALHAPSSAKFDDLALELWTASADQALAVALQIAQAQGAAHMGTEHLLAGVLNDRESAGARTLADMGFRGERLLPLLVKGEAAAPPAWSSDALTAVGWAITMSDPALGAGTGELCCGVLASRMGSGYAVLKKADITLGGFNEELDPLRQQEILVGCTKAMFIFWATRASARLHAKRFAEARSDFVAMTAASPNPHERAVTLNNAAWAALMAGDPAWRADALERVQQALVIEPEVSALRGTLAFALLETGRVVEAVAALDSFDDSSTPPAGQASNLCLRAMAAARLGDKATSARHVREAERLDPACELLERARAELELPIPANPDLLTPRT
jgi:hypothetical protein